MFVRLHWIWLVTAVLVGVLAPSPAHAAHVKPEWGSVAIEDGVLKKSCRNYRYDYAVTAPEDGDWDLSVNVVGPNGKVLWFGYLWEGADAASGTETFRLCRTRTTPGRYKLKAVVSNQFSNEVETYRLPTAKFRLR